uniref:Vitamin K-dependent protein C n=1 Tax=Sphenodon punctatus TaxID=8508 RepID=A0A8D0L9Q7_SPHPU
MWRFFMVWVFAAGCLLPRCHGSSVFYSSQDANQVLKIQKRANTFLEEVKPGSLERECVEETCNLEEASEIFETREATLNFWTKYVDGDQCASSPCVNGTCLDNIGRFDCICNRGWEGRLCQYEAVYTNCSLYNGGCHHFCYEDPNNNQHRLCKCISGYRLTDDHATCVPAVEFPCGMVKESFLDSRAGIQIRLTAGKIGRKGDSPWQVMLVDGKGLFKCGGALIHPSWVLTAAHCVEDGGRFKVRLGKYHRQRYEDDEEIITVDQVVSHENYSKTTSDNDIAMLHLAQPVIYKKFVLPICLPTQELAEQELMREGKPMVVTGWGSQSQESRKKYSSVLNYIEIPLVPRNECVHAMLNYISENMLCAGLMGDSQDSCNGDSGGPMVTQFKNTWFLVGLVSWGEGCGKQENFGVYTKVSHYLGWIHYQIKASEIPSRN